MTNQRESHGNPSQLQSDKFKEAARELEADEDESRWEKRLKRVARAKTLPDPPPHDPVVRKDGKSG